MALQFVRLSSRGTGLDWTGDQITDLTPDAQIAGIKIQFPTTARHHATTPVTEPTARKKRGAKIASLFLFSPAFLAPLTATAIDRDRSTGNDGGAAAGLE